MCVGADGVALSMEMYKLLSREIALAVQPCCWHVEEARKPEVRKNRPSRGEVVHRGIVEGQDDARDEIGRQGQAPGIDHRYACRIDHFKVPAKTIGVDGANITPPVIGDPVIDQEAKHASFLLSAPSQREPARSRPWIPTTPEAERTLPSHASRGPHPCLENPDCPGTHEALLPGRYSEP